MKGVSPPNHSGLRHALIQSSILGRGRCNIHFPAFLAWGGGGQTYTRVIYHGDYLRGRNSYFYVIFKSDSGFVCSVLLRYIFFKIQNFSTNFGGKGVSLMRINPFLIFSQKLVIRVLPPPPLALCLSSRGIFGSGNEYR